jgi:hypothetical protein
MNTLRNISINTWVLIVSLPLTIITFVSVIGCKDLMTPTTFTNPFGIYPEGFTEGRMVPLVCYHQPHPYFYIFGGILAVAFVIYCIKRWRLSKSKFWKTFYVLCIILIPVIGYYLLSSILLTISAFQ